MLTTELLLRLLHDLQELLEGDAAIARDIALVDNLVNIGLGERVVAKVDKGRAELGGGDVARAILVDGLEETAVGIVRGLGTLVVLGEDGSEGLVVQGLGGDLDLGGQLIIAEKLFEREKEKKGEEVKNHDFLSHPDIRWRVS